MRPAEYVSIKREMIDTLSLMPDEALRVLFVLLERNESQKGIKLGLSLNELARRADVGTGAAQRALSWLAAPIGKDDLPISDLPYIILTPKGKNYVITIHDYWIGEKGTPIPFTTANTDDTKLARVEGELQRLVADQSRALHGEGSGLVEVLRGEERDLIQEIEGRRGYGLSVREAYLTGKAVSRYGPDRFKSSWRQLQRAKDPIRAAYGALMKGAKGTGAKIVESEPFVRVTTRSLDDKS